jgi:aminomethyltransferase
MTTAEAAAKRTALYDDHVRLGARLIPFGGFDMPVQYAGILQEHKAVRNRAGLFDLSHMGQFVLEGENVPVWADELTINAVSTMKPLQARYNIFCNPQGGAHDDVIFYRLDGRWLLVVNASNADKMWAHLNAHLGDSGVKLTNLHGRNALIAIQGPKSVEMLSPHVKLSGSEANGDIGNLKYYFCAEGTVYGKPAVIARTGYTGEDGFEIFSSGADASFIWNSLLADHAADGLEPCGLGARDVLRLEAGMPLYGHEMDEEITPVQAGLTWALKLNKPKFIGKEVLAAQLERDDYSRIAGLVMAGPAPARGGYKVFLGNTEVGEVRSGSKAPSCDNRNIATALVSKDASAAGTTLHVEIRGTKHEAVVTALPFYKRNT